MYGDKDLEAVSDHFLALITGRGGHVCNSYKCEVPRPDMGPNRRRF